MRPYLYGILRRYLPTGGIPAVSNIFDGVQIPNAEHYKRPSIPAAVTEIYAPFRAHFCTAFLISFAILHLYILRTRALFAYLARWSHLAGIRQRETMSLIACHISLIVSIIQSYSSHAADIVSPVISILHLSPLLLAMMLGVLLAGMKKAFELPLFCTSTRCPF